MRFRKGQYLLFGKCVAKINKIENRRKAFSNDTRNIPSAKLRKFSKGNTTLGYSYQQYVNLANLEKMFQTNKVRIISPEEIMQVLLVNFEGCMPIKDMRMI